MPDEEPTSDRGTEGTDSNAPGSAERDGADKPALADQENVSEAETQEEEGGVVTVRLETIANILTAAVAIAAILLSVWEGMENRRHNRLSVLPHLDANELSIRNASPITNDGFPFLQNADSLYAISYSLENSGLGPAVIKNFLVFEDGEVIYDALDADSTYWKRRERRDLDQLPFEAGFFNDDYEPGDMLKAGEVHGFISVPIPFAARAQVDSSVGWLPNLVMEEVLEKRSYVFCYCSMYDEDCEQAHLGADPPEAEVCDF